MKAGRGGCDRGGFGGRGGGEVEEVEQQLAG